MATYFIFSDEAGAYQSNPSDSFCRRRPLYIRSAVIMDVESWAILKEEFFELKKKNELPTEKEIKWSYLWSLTKHQNNNEPITENKPY